MVCRNFVRGAHARFLTLIVLMLAVIPLISAKAADRDVVRATLANGLRVVIVRNTLAPVVSTSVNYLVGSDETPAGFPGTAHAQEHMMFRGSPGLSADQLADIGSIMGGNFNANTREGVTQYLFTVPSKDLDVALHIEALRMARCAPTARKVGPGTRRHRAGSGAGHLQSRLHAVSAACAPPCSAARPMRMMRWARGPSFDKTSAEMLKKFHDAWYAPNNAILVVVGDVDPEATLAKVKTLFGAIPAKTLPARPSYRLPARWRRSRSTWRPTALRLEMIAMRLPGLEQPGFSGAGSAVGCACPAGASIFMPWCRRARPSAPVFRWIRCRSQHRLGCRFPWRPAAT